MSSLRLDNIGNRLDTASIPIDTVLQGTAKAWLNLDGTGTIAARDSFNVSGLVDNGVGDYTVNYSVSLPNANNAPIPQTASISAAVVLHSTVAAASARIVGFITNTAAASDRGYVGLATYGDPI